MTTSPPTRLPAAARAALCALSLLSLAGAATATDELRVGDGFAVAGGLARVPVYVRDLSATPLGVDRGLGRQVQDFALHFRCQPAASVAALGFTPGGVLAALTPRFDTVRSGSGELVWIGAYGELAAPVLLSLDGAAPGDLIGHLEVTVAAGAVPGSEIDVELLDTGTALGNSSGSVVEGTAGAPLRLVAGHLAIGEEIFSDGFEGGTTGAWGPGPTPP